MLCFYVSGLWLERLFEVSLDAQAPKLSVAFCTWQTALGAKAALEAELQLPSRQPTTYTAHCRVRCRHWRYLDTLVHDLPVDPPDTDWHQRVRMNLL